MSDQWRVELSNHPGWCRVVDKDGVPVTERVLPKDAHLIAAVPEMAALLDDLHADLVRYSKLTEEVWSSGSIAFGSMADDIYRLLAKARGEASRADR